MRRELKEGLGGRHLFVGPNFANVADWREDRVGSVNATSTVLQREAKGGA